MAVPRPGRWAWPGPRSGLGAAGRLLVNACTGLVGLALLALTLLTLLLAPLWAGVALLGGLLRQEGRAARFGRLLELGGAPLGGLLRLIRALAERHRRWAGRLLGEPIPGDYQCRPGPRFEDLARCARDPATWGDFAWLLIRGLLSVLFVPLAPALLVLVGLMVTEPWVDHPLGVPNSPIGPGQPGTVGGPSQVIVFAFGLLTVYPGLVGLAWWVLPRLCRGDAVLTRLLIGPLTRAKLVQRVTELTESRAETVDAQAAELRRIERDLHDGAQARLIALAMELGLASDTIESDPAHARELVEQARQAATQALSDLRNLVRGIHPPVLADRGLAGAIEAAALLCPIPVQIDIELPGRAEPPVESALYFVAVEALTNVTKHSRADRAWVRLRYTDGRLRLLVGDDGAGGADPAGNGLSGIRRRLSAFDGSLTVDSPAGGPTELTMELPCVLSSPKTSPSSGTA